MLTDAALPALAEAKVDGGAQLRQLPLATFAPAARLLLRQDRADGARLAEAMRLLATIGRPWTAIGVNVGALAAPVDSELASAAREAMSAYVRRQAPAIADAVLADRLGEHAAGPSLFYPPRLADPAGHVREEYHALAVHLCLAAFARRYETLSPDVWAACEQAVLDAVAPLRLVEFFQEAAPPAMAPLVLWSALGLMQAARLLSRDVDLDIADAVVATIVDRPGHKGSLHPTHSDDTIDTWTYRELVGLHALANIALLRRNAAWIKRVREVAMHHVEHTQPDNATTQPWALFAFLWSPGTRPFAEQQMHDATVQGASPISAMLLADAADALAEFG